jgi:hypothetical protein
MRPTAVTSPRDNAESERGEQMINVQEISISKVASVYSGKNGLCCCGCAGRYSYAKAHQAYSSKHRGYAVTDDEISDRECLRVLRLVQAEDAKDPVLVEHLADDQVTTVVGKRRYMVMLVKEGK